MTRIRGLNIVGDFCGLEEVAAKHGGRIHFRAARCEHGKTPEQTCRDCEGGYVQDTSVYANLPDLDRIRRTPEGLLCIAVLDDGSAVGFLTQTTPHGAREAKRKARSVAIAERRAGLEAQGFSPTLESDSGVDYIGVRCTQCEALVINGVACHERGCPNDRHVCHGCHAMIPVRETYCAECRC
jgi:hypothetical protein